MRIRSLDPTDQRAAMAKVTGAAALLISKLFKIAERAAEREEAPQRRDRLSDKDAGDIYRLFQARREDEMAERIRRAAAASMSADVTAQALEYLARLFGRRSGIGIYMATRALWRVRCPPTPSRRSPPATSPSWRSCCRLHQRCGRYRRKPLH